MKKIIVKLGLTFFFICSMQTIQAQAPLYEINTLQKIEVYFSNPNWDYKLDSLKNLDAGSLMADWVKINGIQYDSVGVKYKGNSSYDSTKIKNPLHITLDKYKNQNYQGYKDIKLSNGYSDPSMIREVLGYSILGNYMDCPKSILLNCISMEIILAYIPMMRVLIKSFVPINFILLRIHLLKAIQLLRQVLLRSVI